MPEEGAVSPPVTFPEGIFKKGSRGELRRASRSQKKKGTRDCQI